MHHVDQLGRGDIIGLQPQRIDQDLQHFVAMPGQTRLQDCIKPFQTLLQILGHPQQRAFGQCTGQIDDDDREFGEVDLVYGILVESVWKIGFGIAHLVAYIGQDLGLVPAEFEFERDTGKAFGRGRCHCLQAVQIAKFGFHRLDQQSLAVLGRNAGKGDSDEQCGDFDVGLALLGKVGIGQPTGRQ